MGINEHIEHNHVEVIGIYDHLAGTRWLQAVYTDLLASGVMDRESHNDLEDLRRWLKDVDDYAEDIDETQEWHDRLDSYLDDLADKLGVLAVFPEAGCLYAWHEQPASERREGIEQ